LEGMRLKQPGGAFPPEQVLDWAEQLLDALEYLHTQQPPVVHRDIKPQNLKLTSRGQIILLDFGLAKDSNSRVTATGSVFGFTPSYAPLEQIQGTGTDPRSDLYSLAATLYHLLTGVAPPDVLTRLSATSDGQPDPLRPPHEISPRIPAAVSNILLRAMSVGRGHRQPSATEMRRELREAMRQQDDIGAAPTVVTPPKTLSPTAPPDFQKNEEATAQTVGVSAPTHESPKRAAPRRTFSKPPAPPPTARRRSTLLAGVVVVVVMLASVAGLRAFFILSASGPREANANRVSQPPASAVPSSTSATPKPSSTSATSNVGGAGSSTPGRGTQLDFTLVNKTGVEIHKVYISPHDSNDWEKDVLGKDTLPNGKSVDIKFHRNEKAAMWDLRVEDSKGNAIEWENLNLLEISKVTLHYKDGKATAETE
nr:protein kinase [Acidobacteriota bacterium]